MVELVFEFHPMHGLFLIGLFMLYFKTFDASHEKLPHSDTVEPC